MPVRLPPHRVDVPEEEEGNAAAARQVVGMVCPGRAQDAPKAWWTPGGQTDGVREMGAGSPGPVPDGDPCGDTVD